MIEAIADMPGGTLGFRVTDELTDSDYADVFAPRLRDAAVAGEVRLLMVAAKGFDIGSLRGRFEAARSDPDLDLGHSKDWRRVAIVADAGLLFRRSFPVFARIIPVDMKLFGSGDEAEARTWLTA